MSITISRKHKLTRRMFISATARATAIGIAAPALLHQAASADDDRSTAEQVGRVVEAGIKNGYYSGAVVMAGRPGRVLLHEAFGHARVVPKRIPMCKDSVFDLASVTKVVAATTACAVCVDDGLIDLDQPIRRYLPQLSGKEIERVTLRQVGAHTSGLGNNKFCTQHKGEAMLRAMLAASPRHEPGSRFGYSCLNFILLSLMVEEVTKEPFGRFCQDRIFRPMGMSHTRFGPVADSELIVGNSVKRPGQISDGQARAAGRPVGNAGLFSNATDLARFCQMMLGEGRLGDVRILSKAVIDDITRRSPAATSGRGFGWDLEPGGRPKGLSDATYYHTGWTGQSIWIDPRSKLYVIVLTNRDHELTNTANPKNVASLYNAAKRFRVRVAEAVLAASNGANN